MSEKSVYSLAQMIAASPLQHLKPDGLREVPKYLLIPVIYREK